ncbi:hypothetical protein TBLA_0C04320 [Henningerozyma blattae CBS 6284]|uniref:RRM domain-containing protein n=1 Tax=Henningerozyma blattae (strain ATCC 34711 / CBS 6284 / DSM 70876 / NBRC 10599 / NRRL Y-10934 / UCD 77-7) TaxID=1071380 RepID=I2H1H8_HENB6|nr:hypothetical protein TBLA_0C04320 [Tetrapisispora blattae CBS 6284]CCH60230.1 hypothetical protein TBLA_0C04320 [Tetrapisispora blattae CBS 6284]
MNRSKTVYLGSIPYDQTEEQILDLCQNIGPVQNLRMMFDPMTGKSKGYAFVEFKDLNSSASAVRNLNGLSFGSRVLKCGYSNANDSDDSNMNNSNNINSNSASGGNMGNNILSSDNDSNTLFNVPEGVDVNINMTTPAMMISSLLARRSKEDQLQLLKTFQIWAKDNNDDAVNLIKQCPQLGFVIAELLLSNGLSKVDDLTQLAVPSNSNSHEESSKEPQDTEEERQKKIELIRKVMQLSDAEISILPDDEKMALWDLKQSVANGEIRI